MAMATVPYRLQIFLDDDVRQALKNVAHKEKTSMQQLVAAWLVDLLRARPEGQHLPPPDKPA